MPHHRPLDAREMPRFSGIRTFMRAPHTTDLAGVDAAVYGIPFDTATSYRTGARFGPEAIRSASALLRPYNPALEVDVVETLSIVDYGDVPVSPGDTERTYGQVEQGLAPLVEAGVFPLALGGDHSVTLAELRVLARKHGPLALVQLDAHGDTWDEYFGQRYFHGTTFKRAVEEKLIEPAASVQAGLRGSLYGAEDIESARELGFAVLPCDQLRTLGPGGFAGLVGDSGRPAPRLRLLRHRRPRPGVRPGDGDARGRRPLDGGSAGLPPRVARNRPRRRRRRRGLASVRRARAADGSGRRERRLRAPQPARAAAQRIAEAKREAAVPSPRIDRGRRGGCTRRAEACAR